MGPGHVLVLAFLRGVLFFNGCHAEIYRKCSSDSDCDLVNGHCQLGNCACNPNYVSYNGSACLQTRLLDQECLTDEQCATNVAQSSCVAGKCRCAAGHLQFRRHTCLPAAKPGDVCVSDEHCKLWSKRSRCKFLIQNLIGRCACNDGAGAGEAFDCLPKKHSSVLGRKSTAMFGVHASGAKNRRRPNPSSREDNSGIHFKAESEEGTDRESERHNGHTFGNRDSAASDPFYDQKKHHPERIDGFFVEAKKRSGYISTTIFPPVTTLEPHRQGRTYSSGHLKTAEQERQTNLTDSKNGGEVNSAMFDGIETAAEERRKGGSSDRSYAGGFATRNAVSLGLPCVSDEQCLSADPESRCIHNVCDCANEGNGTGYRRESKGCAPETFQCRESGACISWFFVCDGRKDCTDGSDEECSGPTCPRLSFRCGESGVCVSRSVICDGTKNCPDGEDELFCDAIGTGCPEHSFRCEGGQCLPEHEFCNAIPSCPDGSDEREELCGSWMFQKIPKRKSSRNHCPFRCDNGRCRSTAIICSGKDGCGDNSDERRCRVKRCPSDRRPLALHPDVP